jgi:hypothetical protein
MIKHLALAAMTMAGAASTISPAYAEEPDCIKHGREVPCIEMSPRLDMLQWAWNCGEIKVGAI